MTSPDPPRPMPWRAILLGAVLLPPFTYFGMVAYIVVQTATWMGDSLLRGPLLLLFLLTLSALLLRKLGSKLALDQRELLILFSMLSLGTAMCGTGWAMFVVPTIAGAPVFYGETGNPAWLTWVDWIPKWFMVQDHQVIWDLHYGQASLYTREALRALAPPLLTWSAFMVLLVTAHHAVSQLVAKPWIERERLTFPLTMLPLEMTRVERPDFWRNRVMWAGFGLAALIESWNSVAYLYPAVPMLPVKLIQWPAAPTRPFSGFGSIWTAVYPFMVGIAFLLPLDVSLSLWGFFLLTKVQDTGAMMLGFRDRGGLSPALPPYHAAQNSGAVLMLALILLWRVRGDIARGVLKPGGNRVALVALGISLAGILILTSNAALPWGLVAVWFVLYLLVAITMGRLVAESGIPTACWPYPPTEILFAFTGSTALTARQLTAFAWLRNFDERYADTPIMHYLTGLRLYHDVERRQGAMHVALAVAAFVGILGGLWALLHLYFTYGLATAVTRQWPAKSVAVGPFRFLQALLDRPHGFEPVKVQAMAVGAIVMALLVFCRERFVSFPVHPIGYAVAGNWAMQEQWFPFLVSWALKLLVLRTGGMKAYRRVLPFFLGLILGDLVVPVLWAVVGVATGQQMYLAFPH